MRILSIKKNVFILLSTSLFFLNLFPQDGKTDIIQNPKFEELLAEKRKISSKNVLNDKFSIQIFSGDNENSRKSLSEFRKNNKNVDATIVFNTPIYKVWIGNYNTRIEVEKKLLELKKKYPNAFLVKPNK